MNAARRGMDGDLGVFAMETKRWNVELVLTEDDNDDITTATAVLYTDGGERRHECVGRARRNPADPAVPEIGDELAAGRALADLSSRLLSEGAADVARMAQQAHQA
ncbi:hypothetical protein TBS_13420 [Thermobispora bispora]